MKLYIVLLFVSLSVFTGCISSRGPEPSGPIAGFGSPPVIDGVFAEGELTEREKALIALAVAHAVQCPYCIDAYANTCLEKGSNQAEMVEAIHVATAIRGGASLVHGVQMQNTVKKVSI